MSETTTQGKTAENGNGLMVMPPDLLAREQEVAIREREFALQQRQAKVYADSSLVPQHYRGNIGNVLIAQNMAKRMNGDLLMIMQNLYVVHGNPGWSSQYLIATFNANGRFSAIKYEFDGENDDYGCSAYCTENSTGEKIVGTKITLGMAKAEGWATKNGSKWKTMPDQMFRYRSAAFLIRATAPEIAMGLLTKEELEDIHEGPANGNGNGSSMAEKTRSKLEGLKGQLPSPAAEEVAVEETESEVIEGEVVEETTEQADHVDATIHERPEDADDTATETETETEISDLEKLRGNVIAQLEEFPLKRRKDFIAGKTPVTQMNETELKEFSEFLSKQDA